MGVEYCYQYQLELVKRTHCFLTTTYPMYYSPLLNELLMPYVIDLIKLPKETL